MIGKILLLIFGQFACATAALMVKASQENETLLAAYRQLLAALLLTPLFIAEYRKHRATGAIGSWRDLTVTIIPGIALGVHFLSWNYGVRLTDVVNSTLIVNLTPIALPFLLYFLLGEALNRRELWGTSLTLAGMALLLIAEFRLDAGKFRGDLICLASMLLYGYYLVMARKNRRLPSIWLYIAPLYFIGGLTCLGVGAWQTDLFQHYPLNNPQQEILCVLGLAVVPTLMGHSILNYSMKHFRGQVVGIMTTGQFVFAGILAYFLMGELPAGIFYLASPLLIGGCIVVLTSRQSTAAPKD